MSSISVKPIGEPTTEYLGAGAIYIGGDIEDWGLNPGVLFGTTKGGNSFSDNAEFREREADSDYFPVEGGRDLIKMTPQLTINNLKISTANLEKAFAGMVTTTGTTYDTVTRKLDLSGSYEDVIWYITRNRAGKDMAVQVKKALGDGPFGFTTNKDNEIVAPIVWTAHADSSFDITDAATYPWDIKIEK